MSINKPSSLQLPEITNSSVKCKAEKDKDSRPKMLIWDDYNEGKDDSMGILEQSVIIVTRPGYTPPYKDTLSGSMLDTLNGWTSPKGNSVYNYIITTPSYREYLYTIEDYSEDRQTENLIANKISDIIEKIGSHHFVAVVMDNGSNIHVAQQSINHNYSHILSVRCIAHALNLLSADLVKNTSIKEILKQANMLVSFIQKSYLASQVLQDTISSMNIRDRSLETYCETRWASIYDMANSIIHVRPAIDKSLRTNYTHLQELAKTMFAIVPSQAS
ncbi:10336_t:CDS:2, partial [Gigaspora margarita]